LAALYIVEQSFTVIGEELRKTVKGVSRPSKRFTKVRQRLERTMPLRP